MTDLVKPVLPDPFFDPVQLPDDDVDANVDDDVMMTSSLTRSTTRPGCLTDPANDPTGMFDPTWSTARMFDLTRLTTRMLDPTRSTLTRSTAQQNVPRASTRCHTRRAFWWRVRARVRSFLGNPDIYKLVSKFSTMWYIYFACLKLLHK